jgi:hypothetical protein
MIGAWYVMWNVGWATPVGLGVFFGGIGIGLWGLSSFFQQQGSSRRWEQMHREEMRRLGPPPAPDKAPPDDPD